METKGRIKSFDAFRGFVILLVVTYGHYWQFTPAGYYADGTGEFISKMMDIKVIEKKRTNIFNGLIEASLISCLPTSLIGA